MKRKVQKFRLLLVGLAIFIGGSIAWASTVGSGLAQQFGFFSEAEEVAVSYSEGKSPLEVIFDGSTDKYGDTTAGEQTIVKDGISLTVSNGILGSDYGEYRIYKGQTLTVASTVGKITKVVFTCKAEGDAQYGPGCFEAPETYTYEGNVGTWTGESDILVFTASTNQVRATSIVVTIAGEEPTEEYTDLTAQYLVNAGFDEDLTWNSDGSKKGEAVRTTELSDRSIAYVTEDGSLYATVNPNTPKSRSDGRTFDATNGFVGQVKGWSWVTERENDACEWIYFGTLPYDLEAEAIPISDDGTTYLSIPSMPKGIDNEENAGVMYLRAGWGGSCAYKQEFSLPAGNYELTYQACNVNVNTSLSGTNLCNVQVTSSDGETVTFADSEPFDVIGQWTKHVIPFSVEGEGLCVVELGFQSANGSSNINPWVCFDDVRLFSGKQGSEPVVPSKWDEPVYPTPVIEPVDIQDGGAYYIYNVGCKQYLTGANNWGTQISVTQDGAPNMSVVAEAAQIESDGTIVSGYRLRINGTFENGQGRTFTETYLFRDGEESGFIDWNNQNRNKIFIFTKDNSGYYRIQTTTEYDMFPDASVQYAYAYNPGGAVQFNAWETDVEDVKYIEWAFVAYDADNQEALQIYDARLELYDLLNSADAVGVDTDVAGAVYTNDQATLEEIENAIATLKTEINRAIFEKEWAEASEDNPLDVTEYCMQNADFSEGNINGWNCTFKNGTTATNVGFQSAYYSNNGDALTGAIYNEYGDYAYLDNFIEAWSQSSFNNGILGNAELSQTIYGLPAGEYMLVCDAIATDQYRDNNPVSGVQIFLANASGMESVQEIATYNGNPEHFTVRFISDGSGSLTCGLRTKNTNANWIAADNFRIFFYGKALSPGAAYLKLTLESTVIDYEGVACNAVLKEAYIEAFGTATELVGNEEATSEECAAQAEKLKAAYEALKTSIADYATVPAIISDLNKQLEVVKELNKEALTEAATTFIQNFAAAYEQSTLISEDITSAKQNFKAVVSEALTANMEPGDDLTLLITNPTFDTDGTGWNLEGTATVNYSFGTAEVYHQAFDFYQVIPAAAPGVYRLSCTAFNRMDGTTRTAKLYGGISEERLKLITDETSAYALYSDTEETHGDGTMFPSSTGDWPYDTRRVVNGQICFTPNSMEGANIYFGTLNPTTEQPYYSVSTQIVLPEQGDLRIGIKCEGNAEWVLWDNFKLEYVGSDDDVLADYLAQLKPYLSDDVYYQAALREDATTIVATAESGTLSDAEAYQVIGTMGNLIDVIQESVEAYATLTNAITIAEERLATTENISEDIATELQTLLDEAKGARNAGSYTNEEAVAKAAEISALSRRLQYDYLIIEMTQAGTLGDLVLDLVENFSDVKGITIIGPMNDTDIERVANMANLEYMDLSNAQLNSIGANLFQNHDVLQTVRLPKTLTSLGYRAFSDCDGLTSVTIAGNITSTDYNSSGEEAFYSCDALEEVIIEEGVRIIGYEMFENCYRLSKLTLPLSLTTISYEAFRNCYSLATIPLPGNLQSIGDYAFYRDNSEGYLYNRRYLGYDEYGNYLGYVYDTIPNLCPKQLEIPAKVTSIGEYAFYNLGGLESVTLNEGLTSIGSQAFNNTAIRTATFPSTLSSVGYSIFNSGTHYTCLALNPPTASNGCPVQSPDTLYVPMLVTKAYKQATGWSQFKIVGADIMPNDITVNKQMRLDFASATIPEGYKPNITIQHTNVSVSSSSTPTTLGALEVKNGGTFSAGMLTLHGYNHAQRNYYYYNWGIDNGKVPQYATLMTDGTMRADNIDITMSLTDGYWNFISTPYDVRVGDITCETAGANWVIRRYDGEARAAVNLNNTWVNMGEDDILEAGKGYIMHCSYSNSRYNYCVFHFPALNNQNKNLIFSASDRTIQLAEYQSEYAHNRSWNLIGNPYPAYIEIGSMNLEAPITVWDGYSGYHAFSPIDDYYVLCPGEAFFVQRPLDQGSVTFPASARQSYYDVTGTSNRVKGEIRQGNRTRSVFNLFLSDGEKSDRTRVVINPEAGMEYEVNRDAAKFAAMDASALQLSSTAAGVEYAINERPLSDGSVQLQARFGKSGDYTLRLETKATESVILIDELTGTAMELNGSEGYTFAAEAGVADKRFRLLISSTADGIAEVSANELAGARVYTLDGKLLPAGKPATSGIYLIQQNGSVRKVSVK